MKRKVITWLPMSENKLYHVSDDGRVRSFYFGKSRILKPVLEPKGYLRLGLTMPEGRKFFRVHRLVAALFLEKPEGCTMVDHIDRDRANNNVSNLRWVSYSINNNNRSRRSRHCPTCSCSM